jgi:hypothetical protein
MTPSHVPISHPEAPGAKVYDLSLARARRAIPASVLDEMEAASRMFDALHAQGHALRFEESPARVRAELRTVGGDVVRTVPLAEAIDVLPGPDFAA